MNKLEKLFKIAEDNEIAIEYVKLPKNIYGIYYKDTGSTPAIGINRIIMNDERTLTCVLAEELGHHFTTVGDTTAECYCYIDRIMLDKTELKALRWAYTTLLTKEEIVQAIKECSCASECAEKLGVTEAFYIKAINDSITDLI